MSRILSLIRREPVLIIAAFAALASCFLIPPDKAYLDYIDLRTLALLYCLMTVIAGFREAGLFTHLASILCNKASSIRIVGTLLVLMCFISSMLITNDVALLTFVPFAVIVLGHDKHSRELITVVVLQTVAANLGSMLTPVGNPQNLFLYSFFNLSFKEFIEITFTLWALSLVLILAACIFLPKSHIEAFIGEKTYVCAKMIWLYAALFAVCIPVVLRLFDWPAMLAITIITLLIFDRKGLLRADFMLLLTFVAFFIFSGNLARVESISYMLHRLIYGHEYLAGVLTSQVISNVPAALLLSNFTDNSRALILGVNAGGLGTPVASLASLISMKIYSRYEHAKAGHYLIVFLIINFAMLLLLSLACLVY